MSIPFFFLAFCMLRLDQQQDSLEASRRFHLRTNCNCRSSQRKSCRAGCSQPAARRPIELTFSLGIVFGETKGSGRCASTRSADSIVIHTCWT